MDIIVSYPMDIIGYVVFYKRIQIQHNKISYRPYTIHDEVERFDTANKQKINKNQKKGRYRSYDQNRNPLAITQFIYPDIHNRGICSLN